MEQLENRLKAWIEEYKLRNDNEEPRMKDIKRYPRIHILFKQYNLMKEENMSKVVKAVDTHAILVPASPKRVPKSLSTRVIPPSPLLKLSKLPGRKALENIPRTPERQQNKCSNSTKYNIAPLFHKSPVKGSPSPLKKVTPVIASPSPCKPFENKTFKCNVSRTLFSPTSKKYIEDSNFCTEGEIKELKLINSEEIQFFKGPSRKVERSVELNPKLKISKRKRRDPRNVSENFVRMNLKRVYKTKGRKKFRRSGFNAVPKKRQ